MARASKTYTELKYELIFERPLTPANTSSTSSMSEIMRAFDFSPKCLCWLEARTGKRCGSLTLAPDSKFRRSLGELERGCSFLTHKEKTTNSLEARLLVH